ncbi:MAG: glycosyltransferase family 2 protein [Pseudomonadota bacterium]|nr:glycosyltransferase family 2 protein [Pseudomonadota bacterium]
MPEGTGKRFSIVIPHRNGADLLLGAVAALKASWDAACDEVIVVDNASTDDSLARLTAQHPDVAVIRNICNNGFGRACNQGLRQARGEYALILNNDARLPVGALAAFADFFRQHASAGLLAGQLVGLDGKPQRSFGFYPGFASETGIGRKRKAAMPAADAPFQVETLVGACLAVRASAVADSGGFDEDFFFYFEETEWCLRLHRHGWGIWLLPAVKVLHGKGESTRPLRLNAQLEMLRSRLLYYRKAFSWYMAVFLTVWRVLRLLLNTLSASIGVLLTVGLAAGVRRKATAYLMQLAWLLRACPESWGLPDKCLRHRMTEG